MSPAEDSIKSINKWLVSMIFIMGVVALVIGLLGQDIDQDIALITAGVIIILIATTMDLPKAGNDCVNMAQEDDNINCIRKKDRWS